MLIIDGVRKPSKACLFWIAVDLSVEHPFLLGMRQDPLWNGGPMTYNQTSRSDHFFMARVRVIISGFMVGFGEKWFWFL